MGTVQSRSVLKVSLSQKLDKAMKMLGALFFALLVTISHYPYTSSAASVSYPEAYIEDSEAYFVPQLRERRSPQFALSGGGSEKGGTVRLDGQRNVWSNGRTGVDANGFGQEELAARLPLPEQLRRRGHCHPQPISGKERPVLGRVCWLREAVEHRIQTQRQCRSYIPILEIVINYR
nr:hemiptericin [Coridius chinensis]